MLPVVNFNTTVPEIRYSPKNFLQDTVNVGKRCPILKRRQATMAYDRINFTLRDSNDFWVENHHHEEDSEGPCRLNKCKMGTSVNDLAITDSTAAIPLKVY